MPELLHILALDTVGGVEQLFVHFLANPQTQTCQVDRALITGGPIHPHFKGFVEPRLASVHFTKFAAKFKLPKHPAVIRRWNQRHTISKLKPDLGILWNGFGNRAALSALHRSGARTVYYEHGMGWLAAATPANREFVAEVGSIVCASHAARRVMELRWDWPRNKPADVVLNCLRPGIAPPDMLPRAFPAGRRICLGLAARLIPLKGLGMALHAVHLLKQRGHDLVLQIAGGGPLRDFLEREAQGLGIRPLVKFWECIVDMPGFYHGMDLLLVPSVREPFGLVVLEAGANGCPAVGAKVDGIPEAIIDGKTGLCLKPTLSLKDGLQFGGKPADFPPLVYDPEADRLVEPRFLDPVRLADAVEKLLADPKLYERMSAAAIGHAQANSAVQYAARLRRTLQDRLA